MTLPPFTSTAYVQRGSLGGRRTGSPVRTSNLPLCFGHSMMPPSRWPSAKMSLGVGAQPVRHGKLAFSQSIKSVCIALVVNAPHFATARELTGPRSARRGRHRRAVAPSSSQRTLARCVVLT